MTHDVDTVRRRLAALLDCLEVAQLQLGDADDVRLGIGVLQDKLQEVLETYRRQLRAHGAAVVSRTWDGVH